MGNVSDSRKLSPEVQALLDRGRKLLNQRLAGNETLPPASPWVQEHELGRKIGDYYEDHFGRFQPLPESKGQQFATVKHVYEDGKGERTIIHFHPYGQPCWPKDGCKEV